MFLKGQYVGSTSACPKAAKSSSVPYMFQKPTNLETLNMVKPPKKAAMLLSNMTT